MTDTIDTLFLVGHGKDDPERATIPFVLANIEVDKPDKTVEVILIFDGVVMGVQGNAAGFEIGPPFETHDLEQRMKSFLDKGGVISVCTPCLVHRQLQDATLLEGLVRIKGPDLLAKKDLADKILSFM